MPRLLAALAAVFLLAAAPARAQTPLVIVVNFGPGAANDVAARFMATEFTPILGVPVVVKNTTGAAGTIGAAEVVRARPDGNTLLLSTIGPITVQPSYMRNAGYRPTDLVPICQVSDAALVIQTMQDSGIRTLADLEARPGRRRQHALRLLRPRHHHPSQHGGLDPGRRRGDDARALPPPGDVIFAMQQGSIPVFADQPAMVRPSNLHVVAVFAPQRLPEFPEAPTVREASGHDLAFSIWQGLFAPAGTPAPILARYEAACARAVQSPAVRQGMERIQTPVVYRGVAEFSALVAADVARMGRIIEETGLRQAE